MSRIGSLVTVSSPSSLHVLHCVSFMVSVLVPDQALPSPSTPTHPNPHQHFSGIKYN